MMSTVASFPSVRNRGLSNQLEKAKLQKVMPASFATAPDNLEGALSRALLCTSSNVEPTHNTTKNFAPNLR
jgi:hypothetical protein